MLSTGRQEVIAAGLSAGPIDSALVHFSRGRYHRAARATFVQVETWTPYWYELSIDYHEIYADDVEAILTGSAILAEGELAAAVRKLVFGEVPGAMVDGRLVSGQVRDVRPAGPLAPAEDVLLRFVRGHAFFRAMADAVQWPAPVEARLERLAHHAAELSQVRRTISELVRIADASASGDFTQVRCLAAWFSTALVAGESGVQPLRAVLADTRAVAACALGHGQVWVSSEWSPEVQRLVQFATPGP